MNMIRKLLSFKKIKYFFYKKKTVNTLRVLGTSTFSIKLPYGLIKCLKDLNLISWVKANGHKTHKKLLISPGEWDKVNLDIQKESSLHHIHINKYGRWSNKVLRVVWKFSCSYTHLIHIYIYMKNPKKGRRVINIII